MLHLDGSWMHASVLIPCNMHSLLRIRPQQHVAVTAMHVDAPPANQNPANVFPKQRIAVPVHLYVWYAHVTIHAERREGDRQPETDRTI